MTQDNKPFFSIIIPTRQRHETLPFTIQTVLSQDLDDYELIVCDNCSSPETAEVVNSFNSKKIKYIRSEIPLSMSDNWELALSSATGEYVIVFGDDDGIIHNALPALHKIIKETGYQAVRWERVYYNWGNVQLAGAANQLTLSLDNKTRFLNGRDVVKKVIDFKMPYTDLPMLYNSAINRNLIERLKEISGRVFRSPTPDIYSGYAFAWLSENYLSLGVPMTINGGSAKSNGIACYLRASNPIATEFKQLISKSTINYHKKMPFVSSISSATIEPFLQLQDALGITDIEIDMYLAMTRIIKEMRAFNEKELKDGLALIRKSCMHDPSLLRHVELMIARNPVNITATEKYGQYKIGLSGALLNLDASKFGINDVFQVSRFVANFYDYSAISYPSEQNNQTGWNNYIYKLYRRIRSAARILLKGQ